MIKADTDIGIGTGVNIVEQLGMSSFANTRYCNKLQFRLFL
jgi:hypothetical protein